MLRHINSGVSPGRGVWLGLAFIGLSSPLYVLVKTPYRCWLMQTTPGKREALVEGHVHCSQPKRFLLLFAEGAIAKQIVAAGRGLIYVCVYLKMLTITGES